ncbi:envelope-like protein, partial [Trifolium medium]|nr:envelope-like protein [Trifolium medium]
VFDVENLNSRDSPEKKLALIAKRLRSNTGKNVAAISEPVKTFKKGKKSCGPERQWSKVTTPSEPKKKNLKRKAVFSSDSEFEEEQHAIACSGASSKKSVKRKRIPQDVPPIPTDNISFHRVENADMWRFVLKT